MVSISRNKKIRKETVINKFSNTSVIRFRDYTGKHKTFKDFAEELKEKIKQKQGYIEQVKNAKS